jgi:tRNA nucleotidyltransferase (CCA-adding enzyme)
MYMMDTHWEHFAHPADMGIRGVGPTLAEAFAQAAMAMVAVMVDLDEIRLDEEIHITCEEADPVLCLMTWLNAVLYEMDTRRMFLGRFEVTMQAGRLCARAWGESMDLERHQPRVEVKAATYAELKVQERDGVWIAQCIVDV